MTTLTTGQFNEKYRCEEQEEREIAFNDGASAIALGAMATLLAGVSTLKEGIEISDIPAYLVTAGCLGVAYSLNKSRKQHKAKAESLANLES